MGTIMQNNDMEFRKIFNDGCNKRCNRKTRKELTDENICKITKSKLDNLPLRCVGEWAFEKIHYVSRYFYIFSTGMKYKWGKTNYLEICSGPGRCINRKTAEEFDGTSLSIINSTAFEFINTAYFVDNKNKIVDILNQRITALNKQDIAKAVIGDYTDIESIRSILINLPTKSLNLVFIDPTDCSIPFPTIRFIKENLTNVDFIINFAFGTDLKRNICASLMNPKANIVRNKYEDFLGSNSFFTNQENIEYAKANNTDMLTNNFIEEYKNNLKKIGFEFFGIEIIKHYYFLLFASKNKIGIEFWKKAGSIQPNKQYTLNFDDI
jgi:three-Cys-motif partner protein